MPYSRLSPLTAALVVASGVGASPLAAQEGSGIEVGVYSLTEVMRNVSGGVDRDTAFIGNLGLTLTADLESSLGIRGGTLFLHGLGTYGDSISDAVGDLQGVSNIEAPETLRLYEAWWGQQIGDGGSSLLFGLYDLNSEFDVVPAAGLFLQSAHGIGSEFGTSGRYGPSIFPVTSLGLRVESRLSDSAILRAVVADGVPTDPDDPTSARVHLGADDGVLVACEAAFYRRRPPTGRDEHLGKYAVGAWGYTTEFDDFHRVDLNGDPETHRGSAGIYALAEQRLSEEAADPSQGLTAFLRVGAADDRSNVIDLYLGSGLVYQGLIPGRDRDRVGVALAAAHLGDDYRTASRLGGTALQDWEVALELTYQVWVNPWISIQPDLQVVLDPGGDAGRDPAVIVGLRAEIAF